MRTSSINNSGRESKINPEKNQVQKQCNNSNCRGRISVVGIGPGSLEYLTPKARQAIEEADVIVGYKMYTALIQNLAKTGAEVISGTMGHEVDRAKTAVDRALENKTVAVVSSGDPGVYGMAGIVLEVAALQSIQIPFEIIPGVTAATAAASKLGAPLVTDFAVISLSDLLTPWSLIEKRLEAAGAADFVIVLYNPQSLGRKKPLAQAHEILLKYHDPNTPVGVVKQVGRGGEKVSIITLKELLSCEVDMITTIIIGNSTTRLIGDRMVTPRGYEIQKTGSLDKFSLFYF